MSSWFFFFNDTATTEIYTLSLHDALPISSSRQTYELCGPQVYTLREIVCLVAKLTRRRRWIDRKSTRLNSSHQIISYAVFCLKKKKYHHSHPYLCLCS